MDDVLEVIRSSLTPSATPLDSDSSLPDGLHHPMSDAAIAGQVAYSRPRRLTRGDEEDGGWQEDADDMVFDDTGEGAGVEGDLDMEDD
jgi:hypothetical protein